MSGSLIKQQVFGLAQSIAGKMEEAGEELPQQIRLVFKDAKGVESTQELTLPVATSAPGTPAMPAAGAAGHGHGHGAAKH